MGIIVHDSLESPFGFSVSDSYFSLNSNTIEIKKKREGQGYILMTAFSQWMTYNDRLSNKRYLSVVPFSVSFSEIPTENIYTYCYNQFKSKYFSVSDA